MTSWRELPFEVKSLILQHYIAQAEAQCTSCLEQRNMKVHDVAELRKAIMSLASVVREVRPELIRLIEQSRQEHDTVAATIRGDHKERNRRTELPGILTVWGAMKIRNNQEMSEALAFVLDDLRSMDSSSGMAPMNFAEDRSWWSVVCDILVERQGYAP